MHVEIFDREHYFLIMYIESLNNSQLLLDPEFESIVCDSIENFSTSECLYRISSDGESIKYDNESQPKLPFNIAGATIDKLIERMTDLYGPGKFESEIMHSRLHICRPLLVLISGFQRRKHNAQKNDFAHGCEYPFQRTKLVLLEGDNQIKVFGMRLVF
jgi:hypothetical protein